MSACLYHKETKPAPAMKCTWGNSIHLIMTVVYVTGNMEIWVTLRFILILIKKHANLLHDGRHIDHLKLSRNNKEEVSEKTYWCTDL